MPDEIEYNSNQNADQISNVVEGLNANQLAGGVTLSQEQIVSLQARARLVKDMKSGISWLTAIAGFTAINSLITVFKGGFYFVIGLGITQFIDALAGVIAEELAPNTGAIIKFVALAVSLFIAGIFFLFGHFGKKGTKWVVTLGIVLYGLDTFVLLLLGPDYIGILFHILALFYMIKGLSALNKLTRASRSQTTNAMPLHQ